LSDVGAASPSGAPSIYRGWRVLTGAFLTSLLSIGATHYSFGLYVVPVSQELHLSRANANSGIIILSIASALMGPFVGRMLDRWSARKLMICAGLLMPLGYIIISLSHAPWLMALAILPIAFASDATGGMASLRLATRWFQRRRGRAFGITSVAASASGLLMAPIIGMLIGHYGWRTAVAVTGIGAGVLIVLLTLVLVVSRPEEGEMERANELVPVAPDSSDAVEYRTWTLMAVFSEPLFWVIACGTALILASDRAIMISIAPFLSDKGIGVEQAGFMVSVLSGSAVLGKLGIGYFMERFDIRALYILVAGLHIVLLLLFLFYPGYWVVFAALALIGVGFGGIIPIVHMLYASTFGGTSYGTVMGAAGVIMNIWSIVMLRGIGEVHDRTGSYNLAFEILIGAVLLSIILILIGKSSRARLLPPAMAL
jgi:MFS family permease